MFTGSKQVYDLMQVADPNEFRSTLLEYLSVLEISFESETIDFLLKNQIQRKHKSLISSLELIKAFIIPDEYSRSLAKYFAARDIFDLLNQDNSVFSNEDSFPSDLIRVARIAADGIYYYGHDQFIELRKCCEIICEKSALFNDKRIIIIESPLGNVVPVQIINSLLQRNGISPITITLSLPRNEKKNYGITFQEIIRNISLEMQLSCRDIVLYIDDVISGTRFKKISSALKCEVCKMNALFLPIALVFKNPFKRVTIEHIKQISGLRERAKKLQRDYGFLPWFQMPELPKIKIDAGLPVAYESPVVWGEQPYLAGMKKINYVFDLINQFMSILDDLVSNENGSLDVLIHLWSQDKNGSSYLFKDGLLLDEFKKIKSGMNWNKLKRLSIEKYPSDYTGEVKCLSKDEAIERWNWIGDQIVEIMKSNISEEVGNILVKGLNDLIFTMEKHFPPPRDQEYCSYFLRYCPTIAEMNARLIERILE